FPLWNFPEWSINLVLWLLILGAFINVIIAWIYDITPGGMRKTKPMEEVTPEERIPDSRGWKAATYISLVVIVGLIVLNIVGGPKQLRAGDIQSIVILPFENFTGDDQLDIMMSGMHAILINDVGRISEIRVISKTTSDVYKDVDMTIPQIASERKADALIETAVLCWGDTICFQLKVVTPNEEQLWLAEYRVEKSQILNLNNEITRQIADEIMVELTPEEERLLTKSRTVDREAFDAYLRSQQYYGTFSKASLNKARDYLNSAVEKDPDWAPLYMGLANVWMMFAQMGFEAPSTAVSIAYENLNKALELDPDLPEALHLMGWIALVSEWDWAKAEREFLKALAINPSDAISRIWYAHLLCVLQRHDEALPQAELAIDLDPLNPLVQIMFTAAQLFINECEADLTQIEKLLADDPNNLMANYFLNLVSFHCGDYDKVIETEPHYLEVMGGQFDKEAFMEIKRIFNEQGFSSAYEKIVPLYEDLANNNIISPMELAIVHTKANQYDKVMDQIEKGYEIHDPTMPYIATKAYNFEPLYENPRFIAILEKMNLPPPNN
ncbi:MAG: hypothetical protein QNK30_16755, partial [Bacteroidales bacterium]|nr:hypothetical protein [Bacteroidales bacterium]